jgi:hypothetical protein
MRKKLYLTMVAVGLTSCVTCTAQSNEPTKTFSNWASNGPDGKHIRNADIDQYWRPGVWKENANGWRTLLYVSTNTFDLSIIAAGNVMTNSGPGYLKAPYGKFAKFELLNSEGEIVQPRLNAGTNMLKWYYHNLPFNTNQPAWASPTNGSLEVNFPETTSVKFYPHGRSGSTVGDFYSTAGQPMAIIWFKLGDLYSVTNEDDYTLTVCPVLYKQGVGTNYSEVLKRVDLPCVTTKIHLVPAR